MNAVDKPHFQKLRFNFMDIAMENAGEQGDWLQYIKDELDAAGVSVELSALQEMFRSIPVDVETKPDYDPFDTFQTLLVTELIQTGKLTKDQVEGEEWGMAFVDLEGDARETELMDFVHGQVAEQLPPQQHLHL